MIILYVIPSLNLAILGVRIGADGLLESAEVANGRWYLYRNGNEWMACSDTDKRTVRHRWPVREEDNIMIDVRDSGFLYDHYNEAIEYVKEQRMQNENT